MKFIGYREYSLQCDKDGTRFEESCPRCGQRILMCKKYGGMCISGKCRNDRKKRLDWEYLICLVLFFICCCYIFYLVNPFK
jgi:hypothetical protein